MNDVALFSVAAPVHTLAGNGMGQEHFEAMAAGNGAASSPSPRPARPPHSLPRYAPEHFEQITTVGADLNDTSTDASATAAPTARFGQEHYGEIMAATNATNLRHRQ